MTIRTRLAALALAFAAVSSLGGTSGAPAAGAGPRPSAEGRLEGSWTRGAFWQPVGSDATRPALRLEPARWDPHAAPRLAGR